MGLQRERASQHFDEAECWIEAAKGVAEESTEQERVSLVYAHVHATLALVAIQAAALPPNTILVSETTSTTA